MSDQVRCLHNLSAVYCQCQWRLVKTYRSELLSGVFTPPLTFCDLTTIIILFVLHNVKNISLVNLL